MRVPAVCAYPKVLEEMAANHGYFRPPDHWEHNHQRRLVRIIPPIPQLWTCFTHASCVGNEIVSARNRVLGKVPLPTPDGIRKLYAEVRRLARKFGHLEPWTFKRVIDSFPSTRRRRYQDAYDSLQISSLGYRDAIISAFVKAEKMNPGDKVNPDPRMIQARDPRYNLVIAKYLRPVEHIIYNLRDEWDLRMVAKGLNQSDRAQLLKDKFALFDCPVCICIDASRWDKHISKDVLVVEHSFYKALLPCYPEFERVLSWQLRNTVRTSGGVKYLCDGGRMSGDINTALGNVLLAVVMILSAIRALRVRAAIVDDGDDLLVICESSDVQFLVRELPKQFVGFGQEIRIENVTDDIRKVVFCQTRMVSNGKADIMVRDWRKVMSHACCGTKHWNDPHMIRPMLGLVGSCELALNSGVPVLQEFALALIRNAKGKMAKSSHAESAGLFYRVKYEFGSVESAQLNAVEQPITDSARLAFEQAFDMPEWEQKAAEDRLRRWSIDTTIRDYPEEWDSMWEDHVHPDNTISDIW